MRPREVGDALKLVETSVGVRGMSQRNSTAQRLVFAAQQRVKLWGWRRVSNLAFPRVNTGAIPAFEGWGDPSRILGAIGSTGIEIRAQMRLKNGKNP